MQQPSKRGDFKSDTSTGSGGYELGPALQPPGKGVNCLEIDNDDGNACSLFTDALVQTLPGLPGIRACSTQDRFDQGWLQWSFGGIQFAIASGEGTDPKHCLDFVNGAVYSAQGGATGGVVNFGFCLKFSWACSPTSVTFCKLQRQASKAAAKWSGAWALTAFNSIGALGVDLLMATIGYASYPLSRGCRVQGVRQWAILVDTYRFYLAFFFCLWSLHVPSYCCLLSVSSCYCSNNEYS